MNHHEDSNLTDSLKKLDNNIHWKQQRQQQIRTSIVSEIQQMETQNTKASSKFSKKTFAPLLAMVMIIGLSVTLYLSASNKENLAVTDTESATPPATEQQIEYTMSEEISSEIQRIIHSGFDLRLPSYAPKDGLKIRGVNITQSTSGPEPIIRGLYDYQGETVLIFEQKANSLGNQEQLNQQIEDLQSAAINQFEADGAIFYRLDNTDTNRISLLAMTKNYTFSLYSASFSEEEMVKIARSIDLSNIDTKAIPAPLKIEVDDSPLDLELHQTQIKERKTDIMNSDFRLGLPTYIPNQKELVNISKKEFSNGLELVYTQYGTMEGFADGKWDIAIQQEKLTGLKTKEESILHVKNVINGTKEELTVQGNPAFFHMKPINEEGLSSLWIITEDYFYTIVSPSVDREELIKLAESINY
ncbi:DUF4367 domain-containing protein [Sporosarcina sp. FSL K6-1522]|uniref:DUF4367 domain-containing protein n=1 Tax=Sporosarcina sp. FSL K6-1522 TaxID=2921554 RepID=UPI003159F7E8